MKKFSIIFLILVLLAGGTVADGQRKSGIQMKAQQKSAIVKPKSQVSQDDLEMLAAQAWLKKVGYDRALEQMKQMQTLRLQKYSLEMVKLITDDNLVHLKVLKNLETLTLPRQIGDSGLANVAGLTKLTTLNMPNTKVTDAGMVYLKNLVKMKSLVVSATNISDAGVANLVNMRDLEILNLSSTNITNNGLKYLQNMTRLRKLFLFRDDITDAGIQYLTGFQNLERLNIQATKISNSGYQQLKSTYPNIVINY